MTEPISHEDLEILLETYETGQPGEARRRPWTWASLTEPQAEALDRLVDAFTVVYNQVVVTDPAEIVPPCWRQHPRLKDELAVLVWLYYQAHLDARSTPIAAGEFRTRYLRAFTSSVPSWLGISGKECRRGRHDPVWRKDVDDLLTHQPSAGMAHFGFPPL